jgi:hypothetical protein
VDFKILLSIQAVDSQVDIPSQDVELGRIQVSLGKIFQFNLCGRVQAQVVLAAKMDFGQAVFGPQPISSG